MSTTPQHTPENAIGAIMRQNFLSIVPKAAHPQKKVYKYPYLDKEGINETIQNGKRFAAAYNKAQEEKSAGIKQINTELRKETKEQPHTAEQKVLFMLYKQEHKLANAVPMAYNQKVLAFNRAHGTHFLLRSYRSLRNEIAVTFSHLVKFYAAQIRDNNARKLNSGVTTAGTLPKMLTNSESLKRYKVDGVAQCPYQNDAILSHVHNLVDAGILINYKSHGRNMGFSVDFNPEILAVKDYKSSKSQNTDNKLVINFKKGKPTYSDSITRTDKYNNEIKGDAVASPNEGNDALASTTATGNTYKNTKSEETARSNANAKGETLAKNSKRQDQGKPGRGISEELEAKISPTWELCQELAEDLHVNHIPLDRKNLETEAKIGTMSQAVFRELLFQEFMKVISRLKKGNQSAAGAFYRGFEELDDMKLKTFTGRYFTKEKMLEEFEKWIWMVDHAERWAKKRNFKLLYINAYLDTQRRDAKEVGFWYLEKEWNKNEAKKAKNKAKRAKRTAAAKDRKKKIKLERVQKFGYRSIKPGTNAKSITDYQKAIKAVRKFLLAENKSEAFTDLHRYCRHNLNENIVNGLENLISSEREKLTKYQA